MERQEENNNKKKIFLHNKNDEILKRIHVFTYFIIL